MRRFLFTVFSSTLLCSVCFAGPRPVFPGDDVSGKVPELKKNPPKAEKKEPFPGRTPKDGLGRESSVDSVLATVNGEPITLLDVLLESGRDEARLAAMFSGERLYRETSKIREKVRDGIIVRKLVYEEYKDNPFEIGRQHIENMVDSLAMTMGDGTRKSLERKAKAMGTSMEELVEKARERIAVDVMFQKMCDRRVSITPKQVFEAYRENPKKWTRSRRLELQLLLIRREPRPGMPKPEMVCARLSGLLKGCGEKEFSRYVRENSEGPNVSTGGKMGLLEVKNLRPEFVSALKKVHVGEIVGPVETPEGFYFIRVVSESPETRLPFEKVSPEIQNSLYTAAIEAERKKYAEKLKKEAVIRYYF